MEIVSLCGRPCVILLHGAGRSFSAGVDLTAASSIFSLDSADDASVFTREFDVQAAILRCPHPLIACVAGPCFTGGLEVALNCDVLLASSDALFADTHAKVGVAPCWGMSQLLSRRIGSHRALELSLSGRTIDAATAEQWGLINRRVPAGSDGSAAVLAAGRELAAAVLGNWPALVTSYKQTIRAGFDLPLGQALVRERKDAVLHYRSLTPESFAAMAAFLAKAKKRTAAATAKL